MKNFYYYNSPIGELTIIEHEGFITNVNFGKTEFDNSEYVLNETDILKESVKQLKEYFNRKRKEFNLPLKPNGTIFMKNVWKSLCNIPYGETKSYIYIAKEIGNDKACRAVGMANNKNPIPIIIPCHRVIGKNGKLVGYAGGLDVKEKLLELEFKN